MNCRPKTILSLFVLMTCLDWFYVLWVKLQFEMLINAWFVMIPLTGFFYFAFAVIAGYSIFIQKRFGLDLGCCVMLFGATSVTISYLLVFNKNFLIDICVLPILILNLLIVIYFAYNRRYFLPG